MNWKRSREMISENAEVDRILLVEKYEYRVGLFIIPISKNKAKTTYISFNVTGTYSLADDLGEKILPHMNC